MAMKGYFTLLEQQNWSLTIRYSLVSYLGTLLGWSYYSAGDVVGVFLGLNICKALIPIVVVK